MMVRRTQYAAVYGVVFLLLGALLQRPAYALGLFEQVLRNPSDPELNIAFAREAEAEGDLRHALTAYERLLHADPGNAHARAEFNRLRVALSPTTTSLHASLSVRGHSEMLANSPTNNKNADGTLDGVFSLRDERSLSRLRWRSDIHGGFRAHVKFEELSELDVGGVTGPLLQLFEGVTLHVAAGGEQRYIDRALFFTQATSRFTLDFLAGGTRQTVTATIASRYLGNDKFATAVPMMPGVKISDRAFVVEANGNFSVHDRLRPGDSLFIRPRARYIDVNGTHQNDIFDDTLQFQDLREIGTRVAYYLPLAMGDIYVGAGLSIYHRDFSMKIAGGTSKRRDFYLEPSVHFVMPGIFGEQADFRVDYRFKHNDSNDAARDYSNHVLGFKLVRRF